MRLINAVLVVRVHLSLTLIFYLYIRSSRFNQLVKLIIIVFEERIICFMKKYMNKDRYARELFSFYEINRRVLKTLYFNQTLANLCLKKSIVLALSKLPKKSSKTYIINRCILTGRARSVYRKYRLSRIKLRELGNFGYIPGLKKSSW